MTHSRAGTLLLTGLVLIAGCHKRTPGSETGQLISVRAMPLECPGFQVKVDSIRADPAGNTVHLAHGHTVTFAKGAVPAVAWYDVAPGSSLADPATPNYAQIKLSPKTGAPSSFDAPVSIGINYAPCQVKNARLRIFQSDDGWRPMGGADDRRATYVITYVDHFSEYALAYP